MTFRERATRKLLHGSLLMPACRPMLSTALCFMTCIGQPTVPVAAHVRWADGTPVPDWVRDACCGPSDIHHLSPDAVRVTPNGYRVAGVRDLVPFAKTLASQDGDYWIFYRNYVDGTQYVFCFFAPPSGT